MQKAGSDLSGCSVLELSFTLELSGALYRICWVDMLGVGTTHALD